MAAPAKALLEEFVEQGLTVRAMARELGKSPSTIRHWLRRYELKTDRMRVLALQPGARPVVFVRTCPRHGRTEHTRDERGHYRCGRWSRDTGDRVPAPGEGAARL